MSCCATLTSGWLLRNDCFVVVVLVGGFPLRMSLWLSKGVASRSVGWLMICLAISWMVCGIFGKSGVQLGVAFLVSL